MQNGYFQLVKDSRGYGIAFYHPSGSGEEVRLDEVWKYLNGLKIQYVNEIIQIPPITAIPRTEDYIKGLINLRGKIIPVIDVRLRFKQGPLKYDERTCIIVVIVNAMTVGLIVEKIADVIEIKEDNILPPPKMGRVERANHRFVYGIARVGNSVKLLLDPDRLLNDEDLSALELSNNNMITMKE